MLVNFNKVDVEKVINDESAMFAHIPMLTLNLHNDDLEFEETNIFLTMDMDKEKAIEKGCYLSGSYPFIRQTDFETFKNLLEE